MKIEGKDLVGIITIICGTILLALGIDTLVGSLVSMVVASYFGVRIVQQVRGRKR